jgi:hypothetical protein
MDSGMQINDSGATDAELGRVAASAILKDGIDAVFDELRTQAFARAAVDELTERMMLEPAK